MANDSIFVCFLCEEEFHNVDELNSHMSEHKDSDEGQAEDEYASDESDENEYIGEVYPSQIASRNIKMEIPPAFTGALKTNGKDEALKSVVSKAPKSLPVKNEPSSNAGTEDNINNAMRRAMNLKKYIEKQVSAAKMKLEGANGESQEVDDKELKGDDPDSELGRVVMVDKSFFESGSEVSSLSGPTVMNAAEPEGFIIPDQFSRSSYSDNFDQDDQFSADSEDDDSLSETFHTKRSKKLKTEVLDEPFTAGSVNGISSRLKQGAHVFGSSKMFFKTIGSGHRVKGRRGRPSKSRNSLNLEDLDMSQIKMKPRKRPSVCSDNDGVAYQCSLCQKEFKSFNSMKIHSKSHAADKSIPCPYCDEVFPQRYILYEHLLSEHDNEVDIVCPICSKVFTRPDSLKSHMVRMHEEGGGLNCVICGKNFPSQGQLEMHVRIHTGERPFKCDLCSKSFVQKVHLNTHLRTMHDLAEANTTPCRICSKMFSNRVTLREHVASVHRLNNWQYKNEVGKLRKDGKIPDVLPPSVKLVDPLFRYKKMDVSHFKDDTNGPVFSEDSLQTVTRHSTQKIKSKSGKEQRAPGMGTIMDMSNDVIFTPMNFGPNNEAKGRDQEELNIVESAFKVAEEMDQIREGTTTTILIPNDCVSSSVYYSIPMDVHGSQEDDEYAQFAAEHAHIDGLPENVSIATTESLEPRLSSSSVKSEIVDGLAEEV